MLTAVLLNLVLCEGQPAINGECKLFSMHAMHVTSRLSQLIWMGFELIHLSWSVLIAAELY